MVSGIALKAKAEGFNKVQRELKQTGKAARGMGAGVGKAGAAMGGMAAAINPVTAALAIAAAGFVAAAVAAKLTKDAFVGTIKATIKLADELDEIGKKAKSIGGVSGEGLQVVIGAMELAGVEAGATMKSLQKLNQSMGEGLRGTKSYTDAFDQLGVSAEEMAALPLEKRLLKFSAGLEKMGTRAEQAQVGALLMGRAFKDMVVGLDDRDALQGLMDDIRGFGVASNDAIRDSEELKDSILRMEKAAFGLKSEALAPLIPVLTGVTQGMADYLASLDAEEVKRFATAVRDALTEAVLAFAGFGLAAEKALLVALPVMDVYQAVYLTAMGNLAGAARNAKEAVESAMAIPDGMDKAEARWDKLGASISGAMSNALDASMVETVTLPTPEGWYIGEDGQPYRDGTGPRFAKGGGKPPRGGTGAAKVDPLAGLKRELEAIATQLKAKEQLMAESLNRQLEAISAGEKAGLIEAFDAMDQETALIAAHDAELLRMAEAKAAAEKAINDKALAERAAMREGERLARQADKEAEVAFMAEFAANQQAAAMSVLGAVESLAGSVGSIITSLAGENNKEAQKAAKVMFGIQQSASLAMAIVATAQAVALANASAPAPFNVPAIVQASVTGAAQIGAIAAATISGIADAGLPPGALKQAGLNNHTMLAVRNDEMVLDPVGTAAISRMLEQRTTGGGQPIIVQSTVELDGEAIGRTVDNHLVRSSERGLGYEQRVRY